MLDKKFTDEQLEDLINLAAAAQGPVQVLTSNLFTSGQKGLALRIREKYRRLSFELAGALAKEVLELREMVRKQEIGATLEVTEIEGRILPPMKEEHYSDESSYLDSKRLCNELLDEG